MTPQEILEGNKLIAEFMGYDDVDCPNCKHTRGCNWLQCGLTPHEKDEQLKYHSSWDWLMCVVERVESFSGHLVEIGLTSCTIKNIDLTWVHTSQGTSKIEAVWLACLSFIKLYN